MRVRTDWKARAKSHVTSDVATACSVTPRYHSDDHSRA